MKRPLMWYCLLGIFLLYCIANSVATLHPPENLSGEVILCGRIVKKEVKNGRMLLYLKGASICSVSADYSEKTDSGEKTKENSLKEFTNKSTNTTEYEDGKAPFGDDLKRLRNRGVVCYVPDYRDGMDFEDAYVIGKKVYLAGGISLMNEATNPGEFDAAKYYRARGYYYTLYNAEIVKTNSGVTGKDANIGEGNRSTVGNAKVVGVSTWRNSRHIGLPELLYRLRRKCSSKLCTYLGEEYGGIVSAMLFGEKENLSEDTKELFRDGGISHILAISGLHISIIGAFLYAILTFFPLPKKASFILTVGILILYGIMVGFAPSVFRAVFMFAYRLLAKNLKKAYDPPTALALSAFCTCLFFPFLLADSSFLLTYLAFFGIMGGRTLCFILGICSDLTGDSTKLCICFSCGLSFKHACDSRDAGAFCMLFCADFLFICFPSRSRYLYDSYQKHSVCREICCRVGQPGFLFASLRKNAGGWKDANLYYICSSIMPCVSMGET